TGPAGAAAETSTVTLPDSNPGPACTGRSSVSDPGAAPSRPATWVAEHTTSGSTTTASTLDEPPGTHDHAPGPSSSFPRSRAHVTPSGKVTSARTALAGALPQFSIVIGTVAGVPSR